MPTPPIRPYRRKNPMPDFVPPPRLSPEERRDRKNALEQERRRNPEHRAQHTLYMREYRRRQKELPKEENPRITKLVQKAERLLGELDGVVRQLADLKP